MKSLQAELWGAEASANGEGHKGREMRSPPETGLGALSHLHRTLQEWERVSMATEESWGVTDRAPGMPAGSRGPTVQPNANSVVQPVNAVL